MATMAMTTAAIASNGPRSEIRSTRTADSWAGIVNQRPPRGQAPTTMATRTSRMSTGKKNSGPTMPAKRLLLGSERSDTGAFTLPPASIESRIRVIAASTVSMRSSQAASLTRRPPLSIGWSRTARSGVVSGPPWPFG